MAMGDAVGVVALCPRCNGWTMFHADAEGTTGQEWTAQCRRYGDSIIRTNHDELRALMTHSCKQSALNADRRTCEVING